MIALNQETTNGMGFVIMGTKVLHYVEKPETYVSNIINVGAYLSSTEVFKHMAQAFNEHHKNESAIHVNRFYLSLFCKYNRDRLTTNFEDDATILGIVDWSEQIEQISEKGRLVIKQTQLDKFTSLTSLLLHDVTRLH
ncbi:uncharacterized protein [Dysidea avara]|uniref:uncharacterized protein isoform X2 n=1 Tax=Dysidea avara TaxID=196820 RepID=UPI00331C94E0